MIKKITRLSVLSATVAATSCLGMSGIVSADSITTTGPGSYNVISNNTRSYGGYVNSSTWNAMNPSTWQSEGRSFSSWWSNMMSQMSQYRSSCWMNQMNNARNANWTPSGNNWQASWSNWNPYTWESNGQSYTNWHNQMMNYLEQNYGQMMRGWTVPATTSNYVRSAPVVPQYTQPSNSGNTISDTGPGSTNTISTGTGYGSNYRSTNTNNVEVSNSSNQTAVTGNATSNYNTVGGNVSTGNADNQNNSQTNVDVTNSTPSYGYETPASYDTNGGSISDTGPGSYNSINGSNGGRNSYDQTNSNTITSNTSNSQYASTGNATSNGNTFGGDIRTGSSVNSNSNYSSYDVHND